MIFGFDKCTITNIRKGDDENQQKKYKDTEELWQEEIHKYLGIPQPPQEVFHWKAYRVTKILNTKSSAKNQITALKTWTLPVVTYLYGIIKLTDTDLEGLHTLTKRLLTKFLCLHSKSSVIRLYPTQKGRQGLVNIQRLCRTQERNMRNKLRSTEEHLMRLAVQTNQGYKMIKMWKMM